MSASPVAPKIPQPVRVPVLGNLMSVDTERPVASFARLVEEYGPIYRLTLPNREFIVLGGHALIDEACDTNRFTKTLPAPLIKLRELAADGLFTAYDDEPNWALAHRILMPAFSLDAMRGYHGAIVAYLRRSPFSLAPIGIVRGDAFAGGHPSARDLDE